MPWTNVQCQDPVTEPMITKNNRKKRKGKGKQPRDSTNHLSYTSNDSDLNALRGHSQFVSLPPFLLAPLPRRVKLFPPDPPPMPLLMAVSLGSLCLVGYCYSPYPLPGTGLVTPRLAFAKVGYDRNPSAHGW